VREIDGRLVQLRGQQKWRELGQRTCKRGRRGFDVWCSRVDPGHGAFRARVDGDDGLDQELCPRRHARPVSVSTAKWNQIQFRLTQPTHLRVLWRWLAG